MNWVGGARSRIRVKDDKRQQRDFFEKRRFARRVQHQPLPPAGQNKATGAISQDLLFLQALNNATARPRVSEVSQQGSSIRRPVVAVDLDSARPAKKRRIDVFLPNVSPDLARVPSRLELHEGSSASRGHQADSAVGDGTGLSTMEEPLPKFLQEMKNDMRMATSESSKHPTPVCYATEDEQVTPFLEELLHKKPIFEPDTPYNPYSAPGPASLKVRQDTTKERLSPIAGTIPEDLYSQESELASSHSNRSRQGWTSSSSYGASLPVKSHIPEGETTRRGHQIQSKQQEIIHETHNDHRLIPSTELEQQQQHVNVSQSFPTQGTGHEVNGSSFQKMLCDLESGHILPSNTQPETNLFQPDVDAHVVNHRQWRDFVTRPEPLVLDESHGSPLRDERDVQLAEEALEELMHLSGEDSGTGDEGCHSSDWSNSTLASCHSKMPKDDRSSQIHSHVNDNKASQQRCLQSDSDIIQSQQLSQAKAKDHSEQTKCHVDCHTWQEVATQTSGNVATRDVGMQSDNLGKETRSVAVQTEPVETPELQQLVEIGSCQQHPLPLVPSNDVQIPYQLYRQVEIPPNLTGRTENAVLHPSAVVWQSMMTKIVRTTLVPSIGRDHSWLFSNQPSTQPSDSEEVVTHQADADRNIP